MCGRSSKPHRRNLLGFTLFSPGQADSGPLASRFGGDDPSAALARPLVALEDFPGPSHELGAVFGMSHGRTSCVMMPHVMAHNLPATREAQRLIAEAMGRPDVPASVTVGELVARLGLPTRLRDAGATRKLLPTIADGSIAHPWITGNAIPITSTDELLGLLEQAY